MFGSLAAVQELEQVTKLGYSLLRHIIHSVGIDTSRLFGIVGLLYRQRSFEDPSVLKVEKLMKSWLWADPSFGLKKGAERQERY